MHARMRDFTEYRMDEDKSKSEKVHPNVTRCEGSIARLPLADGIEGHVDHGGASLVHCTSMDVVTSHSHHTRTSLDSFRAILKETMKAMSNGYH